MQAEKEHRLPLEVCSLREGIIPLLEWRRSQRASRLSSQKECAGVCLRERSGRAWQRHACKGAVLLVAPGQASPARGAPQGWGGEHTRAWKRNVSHHTHGASVAEGERESIGLATDLGVSSKKPQEGRRVTAWCSVHGNDQHRVLEEGMGESPQRTKRVQVGVVKPVRSFCSTSARAIDAPLEKHWQRSEQTVRLQR